MQGPAVSPAEAGWEERSDATHRPPPTCWTLLAPVPNSVKQEPAAPPGKEWKPTPGFRQKGQTLNQTLVQEQMGKF